MLVHLPAGGTVRCRRMAKDFAETFEGVLHLPAGPGGVAHAHVILPDHMVPRMDAAFETCFLHRTHLCRAGLADIRSRQKHAVHQRLQAVMLNDRSTGNLLEEARAKCAPKRPAGMVGPQRKQEGGVGLVLLKQAHQVECAFPGAAISVYVDLECEDGHQSINAFASTTCVR